MKKKFKCACGTTTRQTNVKMTKANVKFKTNTLKKKSS